MQKRNRFVRIAGVLCLFTALLHLVGGQLSLVQPMLSSNLDDQVIGELVGAWHMVTIVLFYSSWVLLWPSDVHQYSLFKFLGNSFILFGLIFVGTSTYFGLFTPQFILLIPIGVLILLELSSNKVRS